jgi:hypothetical protein
MPYWSPQELAFLIKQVKKGISLSDIALRLKRSEDSLKMKLKRMGIAIPEKCLTKSAENKVTKTTTTTPKLEPVKFSELPSPNEAMQLLWAAIKRLQEPDVTREEAKKLRLILSGVKAYIHLDADYVLRVRQVERRMLAMYKAEVVHFQHLVDHTQSPEEKVRLEAEIKELQGHIAEMEALGAKEAEKP